MFNMKVYKNKLGNPMLSGNNPAENLRAVVLKQALSHFKVIMWTEIRYYNVLF